MKREVLGVLFLFFVCSVSATSSVSVPSSVGVDPGIYVIRSEFDGDTTEFNLLSDEGLANISGMTLENSNHGKIVFLQIVNLTEDVYNNTVDLDSGINISYNRVEILNMSSTNRSARVFIHNLNFASPRILKNGLLCDECTSIGYTGGTFIFDIPGKGIYFAEEGASQDVGGSSGGTGGSSGGGSGGSSGGTPRTEVEIISPNADFSFDKNPLIMKIKQGQTRREFLRITNIGGEKLDISLSVQGIKRLVLLDQENFVLLPGQYKDVAIDFFARESEFPDIYTGRITARTVQLIKGVNLILEVEKRSPLFDIRADIKDKEISPGGILRTEIAMVNVGDQKKVDVALDYVIKNFNDETIFLEHETLAVDKSLILNREFEISDDFPEGEYVFYVKLTYQEEIATSAVPFSVARRDYSMFYIVGIAIIFGIFLFYIIKSLRRYRPRKEKELSKFVRYQARGER